MSSSVVAGNKCCWCGVVEDGGGGSGGPPPGKVCYQMLNLVDVISCILVHFEDGHYLKINEDS